MQWTIFNILYTLDMLPMKYNIQHTTCTIQFAMYNVQSATCSIEDRMQNMINDNKYAT